uniref:Aminotransferase-like plant mobile domain-containing protein n=1 Tax=Fagus sylvatica TaxID=28930 RepID=A0A2N9ED07_FAGSY
MASSSSHPPPDTAMASGGDSEIPTADTGTIVAGSVDDESVDGSRFSPVPEDDREDFVFPLLDPWYDNGGAKKLLQTKSGSLLFPVFLIFKIQRGDMQPVPIDFEFPCSAAADWFHWVADEFLDVKFCALLERAGVAEAILLSRSCNMYRDTEMLRQILRRWCTSTHTFFFSWGELTITLEDVENHWLLPVLGDMDPFAVEMSEEETLVEQALMARSSTRINAWSLYFAKGTEPAVRLCCFRRVLALYPDLKTNLPLVYRWVSLRGKDPDLDPLPWTFEECIVWRPYSYRYAGFSCHSVLYWFSDIASQSFELFPDDTRSLTYLSAVNPGWLPVWSDKGVEYTHYCANRVRRQFGLDQGVPGSPSETLPRTPSIAPFLNDRAFDYWSQSVSRMVIPCGGRLGICTVAMQEYWLRVAVAMADYVNQGRGTKVPLPNHHAHPVETMILSPPTQTAISYADRQNLGFAEWDGSRDGWILYSTKFPSGWKESVKVVEERLRLDSKRGKGGKKIDSSKELGGRSLMAPGTSKKSAAGTSKKKSAPSSTKTKSQPRSKSVAVSKKAKGKPTQKSAAAPPSSGEESPVESATPIEKESAVPTPPSTMYGRTRSKRKAAEEQVKSQAKRKVGDEAEGSDWTPIVIEEVSGDDDIVDAGVGTTEVNKGIVERQEVALESTDEVVAKDSPIDWSDSDDAMADETLGVTVSDEAVLVMADEAVQSTTSIMAEEVPGEIPVSMADVVDEAHEITPVMADEALAGSAAKDDHDQDVGSVDSEETISDEPQPLQIIPFADLADFHWWPSPLLLRGLLIQDADDGGMADTEVRGVDVVPEDVETLVPVEKESVVHVASAAASSSQTQSAVEGLTAKFGDFTTHFKFGAGFGGPMLSLLGSVLADMRRTSFKTLSEPKIFSWRSVVQDLIAVGFDLDFMLEHLRKVARKFFGEAIASEMKIVQEQISSLQSTLAVLVSYQGELMSAARASPEVVEVASPIDGLFD